MICVFMPGSYPLPGMNSRRRLGWLLAILGAGLLAFFTLWRDRESPRLEVLDALPRSSFLVARVDLEGLRGSALAEPLGAFIGGGVDIRRSEDCPIEIVDAVDEIAIALPEADGEEFGVVFGTNVSSDVLRQCAESAAKERGTSLRVEERFGTTLLTPESMRGTREASIAVLGEDLYAVGRGSWLEAIVLTARGEQERVRTHPVHAKMLGLLPNKSVFVLSAVLPASLRDKIRRDLLEEPESRGRDAMLAIVDVDAVAIGVVLEDRGTIARLAFEAHCESIAGCQGVKRTIERKLDGWSKDLSMRVALGPALDAWRATVEGESLHGSTRMHTEALVRLYERLIREPMRADGARAPASPPDAGDGGDGSGRAQDAGASGPGWRRGPSRDAGPVRDASL